MPQDGSNNYQYPPGTPGIPDTTIESESYNTFLDDLVVNDLNIARPIHRGGTGAVNAHDARDNLDCEVATQVVTNYDSHVWEAGSFKSAIGATGAPTPTENFSGICHLFDPTSCFLEARAYEGVQTRYFRRKYGGTWYPWVVMASGSEADADARYVNTTGDTMTGNLAISKSNPTITLDRPGSGSANDIYGKTLGVNRWLMRLGNDGIETGANAGSDFFLYRWSDAGTLIDGPLSIARDTGQVNLLTASVSGLITAGAVGATGTYYFGNTGTKYLNYDGANFNFVGGAVIAPLVVSNGNINAGYAGATGAYYFGNTGTKYLTYDGANFNFSGGAVVAPNFSSSANIIATTYMQCGSGGTTGALYFGNTGTKYLNYDGTNFNFAGGDCYFSHGLYPSRAYQSGPFSLRADANSEYLQWADYNYFRHDRSSGHLYYYCGAVLMTTWRADTVFIHGNGNAYKSGGGSWLDSSDIRIKNVEGEYKRSLDEVAALRPIYYTFKGNDTDSAPAHPQHGTPEENAKIAELPLAVPYPNSNHKQDAESGKRYTGLIAQEVEKIFPEMVTKRSAYINGEPVNDLRDLDTTPLIFALINSVKELKARIEQLEGAG